MTVQESNADYEVTCGSGYSRTECVVTGIVGTDSRHQPAGYAPAVVDKEREWQRRVGPLPRCQ